MTLVAKCMPSFVNILWMYEINDYTLKKKQKKPKMKPGLSDFILSLHQTMSTEKGHQWNKNVCHF